MAIGDTFSLALKGRTGTGAEIVNVLWFKQVGGVGDDGGVNLIDAWFADCSALYAAIMSDQCFIEQAAARNFTQPTFGSDFSFDPVISGDLTGDQMPPQDSAVLQFRTGLIGRRFRGRNFLFPTVEASQNAGQWTTGYASGALAYGASLQAITSGGYTYNQVVHSQPEPEDIALDTGVSSTTLNAYVRGQRRRQIGVGS